MVDSEPRLWAKTNVLLTLCETQELVFTSASAYVDRNMRIDEEEFI